MSTIRYIPEDVQLEIKLHTSSMMSSWVDQSDLPSYMSKWLLAARDEAFKSNFHTSKIGCVIVYKNRIIGRGHNQIKTHPVQKEYDQKYRVWINCDEWGDVRWHTLHAEIDALTNIPNTMLNNINISKAKAYLFRVSPGLELYSGLSLPCNPCAAALSDFGIRDLYYTTGRVDKPFGHCDL